MKIKKKIKKEVSVLEDVICDSCGKSCIDKSGMNFEFMEMKANWGYGSKKDMEQWTAHICENCVDEKLSFINFRNQKLDFQTSIGTWEEYEEKMERSEKLTKTDSEEKNDN